MTMFRKVFGNHVAANREELRVMEATPHPEDLTALPHGPEQDTAPSPEPEPVETPPAIQLAPAPKAVEAEDIALTQRAATLAERAAAAEKQMAETQPKPRPAPAPMPSTPAVDRLAQVAPDAVSSAPAPRPRAKPGARTRTRLLGFDAGADDNADPFANADAPPPKQRFPAGWLVVVDGPGKGEHFAIFNGAAMIGRGEDQAIRLDFGDNAISRQNHAAIAYDLEDNRFYLGHGGKSNIIRLNDRPVLSTETLSGGDMIRIGETTLRFVALCGEAFQWGDLHHE